MAASSRRFPLSSLSARRVLRTGRLRPALQGPQRHVGLLALGGEHACGLPVFVLGVLIASLGTDSGLWGAALGSGSTCSYDFLFTRAPSSR